MCVWTRRRDRILGRTLGTIPVSIMGERNPGNRVVQSRLAPMFSPIIIPAACVSDVLPTAQDTVW